MQGVMQIQYPSNVNFNSQKFQELSLGLSVKNIEASLEESSVEKLMRFSTDLLKKENPKNRPNLRLLYILPRSKCVGKGDASTAVFCHKVERNDSHIFRISISSSHRINEPLKVFS